MVIKALRYKSPPLGRMGRPTSGWTWNVGFDPLVFDENANKDYIVRCQPKDPSLRSIHGPYGYVGVRPGLSWNSHGGRTTIYPGGTLDRSSAVDDTPANTPIESRMVPSLNFKRELFNTADPIASYSSNEGVIEFADPNNELSPYFNYVWDQAPVDILTGYRSQRFEDWTVAGKFTAAEFIGNSKYKTILLRGVNWPLEGLIHDEYYDGSGGLGGDPRLNKQWKPYTVGWCKNVAPVLIDSVRGIHQWSFTASAECMAFKHGGTSLDFFQDYATYEEFVAAIDAELIPSSEYATCLAHSCAAANIDISKGIRVDVKGDSYTSYGFTTPIRRADIVRRIASAYGKAKLDPNIQIESVSFNTFNIRHSATCGYHTKTPTKKADAIAEILRGVLGFYFFRPSTGQMAIGYVRDLSTGSVTNIALGSEGMGNPVMLARAIPRQGTKIGYQKNYDPQDRNDLVGIVLDDPEECEILKMESQYASHTTAYVKTRYERSIIVTLEGYFWFESDAQAEAIRQQTLLSVPRALYRWTMVIDPNIDLLGRTVTLTDGESVLDFGSAKPLLCAGIDSRGTSQVTMTWWG